MTEDLQKLRGIKGIKLGRTMKFRYFNRETTGYIYQDENGFHFEFNRIVNDHDTEIVYYHLSAEDTLDGEDLENINELLYGNNLEFVGFLEGV